MSSAIFPTLLGQSIELTRSALWTGGSKIITAVSGKETSISYWANPRWQWEVKFDLLRSGNRHGVNYTEMQQLIGFFNQRRGPFDSFLFTDPDDNSIVGQSLGNFVVNGMQLLRTFGGFTEPILAPVTVTNVLDNGVPVNPLHYTFSVWGDPSPGVLTFNTTIPAPGDLITADITYNWPVRFIDDQMDLSRFLNQLYLNKSIKMISKK